jgi:HEAT repeat protein
MSPRPSVAVAVVVGAALLATSSAGDDLASKIKALKVEERLAAVETIRREGAKDGEHLLQGALKDGDWEVVERAAAALGERGSAASLDALAKLTLDGPVRRVRVAAAAAMAKLDPKAAADHLTKAAKGPTLLRACEGLAAVASSSGEAARAGLEVGLKAKEASVRTAAAAGLHAFPAGDRAAQLVTCLKDSELSVGAAALVSTRDHPDAALLPALLETLGRKSLPVVLERRAIDAVVALLVATPKESREPLVAKVLDAAKSASDDGVAARFARLVGLAAAKPAEAIAADAAVAALAPMVDRGESVSCAAAQALGRVASDAALAKLGELAHSHASPSRARSVAVRGFAAAKVLTDPAAATVVKECLSDTNAQVREDAAVALGRPGVPGAVDALAPLLHDAEWEVAVAASVSLGKTHDPAAVALLQPLLANKDKKRKDGALVGLGHCQQKSAVPLLIAALGAKEMRTRLTAFEFLKRMTSDKLKMSEGAWKSWWERAEAAYKFPDLADYEKQQKYGYAPTTYGVYQDLDVLVYQSPRAGGDHLEKLLDKLKIEHRLTKQGEVDEAGVEPFGVYVANCTGECKPEDLDDVTWFVHTGGYLFTSCWALTYHAAPVQPGMVRQFATSQQVLDLVTAEPCRTSAYLSGVFDGVTRPKYVLEGAHLIEVLDPERVEVLIDSPECATRWGCGDLAAWWTVGHGLVLDSVNHFDLQGFERAPPMKEPTERMAYAIDTLGLSYADFRDTPKIAWTTPQKAAEEVRDLSAFRFVTNFVRYKRRSGS